MQLPVCCNANITKWPNIGTVFWATVSKASRKCVYQAAAQAHKLKNQWSWEHNKVFVILKTALTGFLVLKGPKYDGSSLSSPQMDAKMGLWISSPNASSGSAPNRNPKLMSTPSQLHWSAHLRLNHGINPTSSNLLPLSSASTNLLTQSVATL